MVWPCEKWLLPLRRLRYGAPGGPRAALGLGSGSCWGSSGVGERGHVEEEKEAETELPRGARLPQASVPTLPLELGLPPKLPWGEGWVILEGAAIGFLKTGETKAAGDGRWWSPPLSLAEAEGRTWAAGSTPLRA